MQDGTIIEAFRRVGENSNRVRTVLPGQNYEVPPIQDKINILTTDTNSFIERLKTYQEATLYQAIIASGLGFGPITAKEIIFLAGFSNDLLIKDMDENGIFSSITNIIDELKNHVSRKKTFRQH